MANGTDHRGAKHGTFDYPPPPYQVLDQYHSKPSKIRVACAGAGATGLCCAYKMERMLEASSWELTLFEKNEQFGGTWWENTYPGVACDIPSHLYTFSWDPNPDWSHYFAYGGEIQQYFEGFAKRYALQKYMKLCTKVTEINWDNNQGIWNITLQDMVTKRIWYDWAHVFINGTGILNTWKWPDIEGLSDFKGSIMHSARWDHNVDFKDKTVGVIGTGSTSVQIVPELRKVAKHVDVFMRSPTWISPPFGATALSALRGGDASDPGKRQYAFTEQDKKRFREDPDYFLQFRKEIEAEINVLFGMYTKGSDLQTTFRDAITKEMIRRMGPGNEKLKDFIIPKWSVGCRRVSPADGYLEALVSDNVTPVFGDIGRVTERGVVVAGQEHKVEILVFNGTKTIDEDWGSSCNMYLGVSAPRFPNYFTIVGPGATWSNGTLIPGIETTVEYSIKMIKKMQTEGILSATVKQQALDDIYQHFDEFHKGTVWQEECRSWFKDGKVKNRIYLWPGSTIHFLKTIKEPRMEDYDFEYRYGNRFAFLGNGDVKATLTGDVSGLSPYVRNSDHPWTID
ncbi:hypothetical protein RBB50_010749 [Rhinocladiella similis]